MNPQSSLAVGTVILDEVLDAIAKALTTRAPECGGLLFGPQGQKLITHFVADEQAEHHPVTYTPSAAICKLGPQIERDHGLEYKGVIHSHPGAMAHPSGPDIENARNALGLNLHLSYFMMPIVTLGNFESSQLDSNELIIPGGKLSHWMVPQAAPKQGRQLFKERISSLTLWSDLKSLAAGLPGQPEVGRSSMLDIEGVSAAAYLLDLNDGTWTFAAAAGYPFIPPLVIPPAGIRTAAPLSWDLSISSQRRFHAAMAPLLDMPKAAPVYQLLANEPAKVSVAAGATKRRKKTKQLVLFYSMKMLTSAIGTFIAGIALWALLKGPISPTIDVALPTAPPVGVTMKAVKIPEPAHGSTPQTPPPHGVSDLIGSTEPNDFMKFFNSNPIVRKNPLIEPAPPPRLQDFTFQNFPAHSGSPGNLIKKSPIVGNFGGYNTWNQP